MSANPGAAESQDSNALPLGKQRNPEVHIRPIPRLVSPGVQLEFVKPKQVKNRYPWDSPNSSMPVLEKTWKQSMNKHLSDVNCTIQKRRKSRKSVYGSGSDKGQVFALLVDGYRKKEVNDPISFIMTIYIILRKKQINGQKMQEKEENLL
ncbi:hypothetical protein PRIPAC_89301 [Pristionchus pacificus]|nr:hypothetical protein PRIPAC_89301 [Pristionchus pacificus]